MLFEYLEAKYEPNEPIFMSDVELDITGVNLRQKFKVLCDSNKIKRFDQGIYYIPKSSKLKGGVALGADKVAKYKYISRNGRIDGYYSGHTFANLLGVTTQVPYLTEIVSNNTSAKVREVDLSGSRVLLRKARIPISKENYRVLQFLDFLSGADKYCDEGMKSAAERIRQYVVDEKIQKVDIDRYIGLYSDKVYRIIYEIRLYEVFA